MIQQQHLHLVCLTMLALYSLLGCASEEATPVKVPNNWDIDTCLDVGLGTDTLKINGYTRTYRIHLPPVYENTNELLPLVIGLHGAGGSGGQFERHYHLSEKADTEGFVAVYPNGLSATGRLGARVWNAGNCCGLAMRENTDDVGFINGLIDKLLEAYRIDPKRIYVTGMSNGGMLAYRLAAEIPNKIAAIAPVSTTMVFAPPPEQARLMPIMHLHSTLDQVVPYKGGTSPVGYYFPPVDSVLNVWVKRNECVPNAQVINENDKYKHMQWVNKAGEPMIIHYITHDGGHSWPGGEQARDKADPPSQVIDANDLIWEFFKRYRLH